MSPELQQVLRELAEIREQMDRIGQDLAVIKKAFEDKPEGGR